MKKINKYIDVITLKFLLVGAINTLIGSGVMFLLYNLLNVDYWLSSASNYIVGSIVSYFLNKYFTFQNKEKSVKQVLCFVVNISVCYLLAYGLAKPMVYHILSGMSKRTCDNISMLMGMGLFVILNYFGQRLFVFKEGQNHMDKE